MLGCLRYAIIAYCLASWIRVVDGYDMGTPQQHAAQQDVLLAGLRVGVASDKASDFFSGSIDAFLGHSTISASQRTCLSRGAQSLTTKMAGAWEQALQTYTQFQGQAAATALSSKPNAGQTGIAHTQWPASAATGIADVSLQSSAGGTASLATAITPGEGAVLAMELAASLSNLYHFQADIAKSCLSSDVVHEFEIAAEHMGNLSFIGGRLVSNGVDIVEELSNAFGAYQHEDFRSFGKDMGNACRKVLLAKRSDSNAFAPPSSTAIGHVTEGLLAGFFGRGFGLQLATDAVPAPSAPTAADPVMSLRSTTALAWSWPPPSIGSTFSTTSTPSTEYPAMTFNVNLHRCVAENMPLLKSAWQPVFQIFGHRPEDASAAPATVRDLMLAMMDLQMALTRCNLGPAQEAMLIDAIHSGANVQTSFSLPKVEVQGSHVTALLASALENFQDKHWYAFGSQLGAAMQNMLVVTFAEKYEVDDAGSLRLHVMGASAVGPFNGLRQSDLVVGGISACAVASFMLLTALAVARRLRSSQEHSSERPRYGCPHDLEAVE